MTITYRKLAADDAQRYREIRLESLKLHPESFGASFEEQRQMPHLMFEQALKAPIDDRFVIGAFDRQRLVGICGFIPFVQEDPLEMKGTGVIIQMYVKSAYRGRKIGLGLIEAVVDEAFQIEGLNHIMLSVKKANRRAIRVYQQAGFQPFQPSKGQVEGKQDELLLEKRA